MGSAWPVISLAGMIILGFAVAIVMLRSPARYGDPEAPHSKAMLLIEIAFVLLLMGGCVVAMRSLDQGHELYWFGLVANAAGICVGIYWIMRLMRKFKDAT